MLDTELKIKKVVKALNKLGTLRGINNPVGLYIFVWDTEKTQSSAIGYFIPSDIVTDLFQRVRELAKMEVIKEMMR